MQETQGCYLLFWMTACVALLLWCRLQSQPTGFRNMDHSQMEVQYESDGENEFSLRIRPPKTETIVIPKRRSIILDLNSLTAFLRQPPALRDTPFPPSAGSRERRAWAAMLELPAGTHAEGHLKATKQLAKSAWGRDPNTTSTKELLDDKQVIKTVTGSIYYRVLLSGEHLLSSDPGALRASFAFELVDNTVGGPGHRSVLDIVAAGEGDGEYDAINDGLVRPLSQMRACLGSFAMLGEGAQRRFGTLEE